MDEAGLLERSLVAGLRLPPEVEEGNVEYKLRLTDVSAERLEHLTTQMKWRLHEGRGSAVYEIGVADDGTPVGISPADLAVTLAMLASICAKSGAEVVSVSQRTVCREDVAALGLNLPPPTLEAVQQQAVTDGEELRIPDNIYPFTHIPAASDSPALAIASSVPSPDTPSTPPFLSPSPSTANNPTFTGSHTSSLSRKKRRLLAAAGAVLLNGNPSNLLPKAERARRIEEGALGAMRDLWGEEGDDDGAVLAVVVNGTPPAVVGRTTGSQGAKPQINPSAGVAGASNADEELPPIQVDPRPLNHDRSATGSASVKSTPATSSTTPGRVSFDMAHPPTRRSPDLPHGGRASPASPPRRPASAQPQKDDIPLSLFGPEDDVTLVHEARRHEESTAPASTYAAAKGVTRQKSGRRAAGAASTGKSGAPSPSLSPGPSELPPFLPRPASDLPLGLFGGDDDIVDDVPPLPPPTRARAMVVTPSERRVSPVPWLPGVTSTSTTTSRATPPPAIPTPPPSTPPPPSDPTRLVAEVIVRSVRTLGGAQPTPFSETRVIVLGPERAGKSTLLGVLTSGVPDNSRGRARLGMLRHKHEVISGRTSHLAHQVVGFPAGAELMGAAGVPAVAVRAGKTSGKADGDELSFFSLAHPPAGASLPIGMNSHGVSATSVPASPALLNYRTHGTWEDIVGSSGRILHLIDTAGHPKYRRTAVTGLVGYGPDAALLVVPGDKGRVGEHARECWTLCKGLGVGVAVVVSKVDVAGGGELRRTLEAVAEMVGGAFGGDELEHAGDTVPARPSLRLVRASDPPDALRAGRLARGFSRGGVVPVFLVSSVTEEGLDELVDFLKAVPRVARRWDGAEGGEVEFQVEEVFTVPDVGSVAAGVLLSGTLSPMTETRALFLGPVNNRGEFLPVRVTSVHRQRVPVRTARAGDACTIALECAEEGTVVRAGGRKRRDAGEREKHGGRTSTSTSSGMVRSPSGRSVRSMQSARSVGARSPSSGKSQPRGARPGSAPAGSLEQAAAALFGSDESDYESEDAWFEDGAEAEGGEGDAEGDGLDESEPSAPRVRVARLRRGQVVVSAGGSSRVHIRIGGGVAALPLPAGGWTFEALLEVLRGATTEGRSGGGDDSVGIARRGVVHIGTVRQSAEVLGVSEVVKVAVAPDSSALPTLRAPGVGVEIGDLEFPPVMMDDRSRSPSPLRGDAKGVDLGASGELTFGAGGSRRSDLGASGSSVRADAAVPGARPTSPPGLRMTEVGDSGIVRFRFVAQPEWLKVGWRVLYRADNGLLAVGEVSGVSEEQ